MSDKAKINAKGVFTFPVDEGTTHTPMTNKDTASEQAETADYLAALLCCLYEGDEIVRAAAMLIEQAIEIEDLRATQQAAPEAPALAIDAALQPVTRHLGTGEALDWPHAPGRPELERAPSREAQQPAQGASIDTPEFRELISHVRYVECGTISWEKWLARFTAFIAARRAAVSTTGDAWISVDERMPEPRKQALLIAVGVGPQHRYTTDYYAGWLTDSGLWERWPHPYPPTHWMPLPAAPQSPTEEA